MPPVHIDRALNLTRASTIRGRDYWLALRGDRPMPARADISPRGMREFLPYVGLIELTALPEGGEDYSVRLAGGKIEELFGSLTGQSIRDTLPPEIAARWRLVCEEVRRSRMPLAATGRVAFNNQRHLKQEVFIAPLGENGTVQMLFGVLDIWPVI
ncbi:MAG TPA: PAS domain-containing protein [Rhizomicrobium sp.]